MADGEELPMSFASRIMSRAETNYSKLHVDKEVTAVMLGLKRFHLYFSIIYKFREILKPKNKRR